jgi:hypothetical protein
VDVEEIDINRNPPPREFLEKHVDAANFLDFVSTRSPVVNLFAREGENSTVVFDGRVSRLRYAKGLRSLDHLLRRPGEEVHALALGQPSTPRPRTAGPRRRRWPGAGRRRPRGTPVRSWYGAALAAYRRRFDDLREELAGRGAPLRS